MSKRRPSAASAPSKSERVQEPLIDEARAILRAEMARRGIGFKRLLSILEASSGEPELTYQSLVNKINRGKFSFAFMLRVCRAMGIAQLNLVPVEEPPTPSTRRKPKGA